MNIDWGAFLLEVLKIAIPVLVVGLGMYFDLKGVKVSQKEMKITLHDIDISIIRLSLKLEGINGENKLLRKQIERNEQEIDVLRKKVFNGSNK